MKLLGFCFGTTALIRMVQVLQGPVLFSRPFHASRWDKPLGTAGLSLSPTAPGLCIHFLLHLLASTHQLLAVVIGTSWWEWGHDILLTGVVPSTTSTHFDLQVHIIVYVTLGAQYVGI